MKLTLATLASRARLRFLGVTGGLAICAAAAAQSAVWTDGAIASLFPPPIEGWTADDIAIEERDTITSGFESFAGAALAETASAGVSIRLNVKQRYSFGDKAISITIDTEDIDSAATVDVITAAFETDAATRKKLESDGVSVIDHDGITGISMKSGNEAARAFNIGSAGVVSLECAYAGCGADLDLMLDQMNFAAVTEFVVFDHRR